MGGEKGVNQQFSHVLPTDLSTGGVYARCTYGKSSVFVLWRW